MASRKKPAPLTQREVQEAVVALLRVATVWARRSFEEDTPRDRPADEALLRSVVSLVTGHQNVPLVEASGSTKVLVRQNSLQEYDLFNTVHQALVAATADKKAWSQAAARLRLAFRRAGLSLTSKAAKQYIDNLMRERPPTELAGRVLQMAGFRGYSSVKAVERSQARARAILARREASRQELVEFFLACFQVPKENLHPLSAAITSVLDGGTLKAEPTRWAFPGPFKSVFRRPKERPYYPRYGRPTVGDPTSGVLDDDYQPGMDDDPADPDED